MTESHNVEYKSSWRDEYLKWICGFANADGGTIYIGMNDAGEIVGVENAKRLLEDIPNKIVTQLGIVCDVRLHQQEGKNYLEIHVDPSPYPVSYNGEIHYRSGATKQQLKGTALMRFLFDRMGFSWEGVGIPGVDPDDLWQDSFSIFKDKALASHRMSEEDFSGTKAELLDKLQLLDRGNITRAGILLFSHYPERHVAACYTRIGRFVDDADIAYEDEVHGSLLEQAEKVIETLYLKYLTAPVHYEGMTRVERYAFPPDAVREMVYNALVHSDWSRGIPIQIKVFDDRLVVSNVAVPPRDLTPQKLLGPHRSEPYNPLIAQTFYRAGYIESWGRGIDKIRQACRTNGNPMAEFDIDSTGMMVTLHAPEGWEGTLAVAAGDSGSTDKQKWPELAKVSASWPKLAQVGASWRKFGASLLSHVGALSEQDYEVLNYVAENNVVSAITLSRAIGLSLRSTQRTVKHLVDLGLLKIQGQTNKRVYLLNLQNEEKDE